MSERTWPVDAVGGAPRYSGRALRQLHSPYLAGATAADPFGARSGVRPGTATGLVTATSTTWRCGMHAGVLDEQPAVEAGPYTYAIDAAVSGAMNAADASNPRTDRVYVQITDAAEGNAAENTPPSVTVKYLAGTARADAPVPALPPRSMRLARINVPKQGGGSPTVTFEAPYSVAAGGVLPVPTVDELKLITSQAAGALALVFADATAHKNVVYRFDGTVWRRVAPLVLKIPNSGAANPADGNGFVTIQHGQGQNPDGVSFMMQSQSSDLATRIADLILWNYTSANAVQFRAIRRDTSAWFGPQQLNFEAYLTFQNLPA